jgi:hypothetical protein
MTDSQINSIALEENFYTQVASLVNSAILLLSLFIYFNSKWVLIGGSGNTIKHNKQITLITQNNTTIKRNTAHKTTPTIKDTVHRK